MTSAVAERPTRTPEAIHEGTETRYEYPGIPTTCDGAEAVVHVETQIAQAAGAYPITSSTTMGGGFNAAVTKIADVARKVQPLGLILNEIAEADALHDSGHKIATSDLCGSH